MSEKNKIRKRPKVKVKRWLRSWVFTPLGKVRIKLINKIERKRCRSIPDCELNWIIHGALADRYPSRYFRDRNDQELSLRKVALFITEDDLSLVDSVSTPTKSNSPRHQSSEWERQPDLVADSPLVNGVVLAVATARPNSSNDPRGSWRGDENSVLRIMNPDSVSSSEDGISEGSRPISVSVFQVNRNVYELSALRAIGSALPAELSEQNQFGQSRPDVADFNFGMANLPVIEELPPQLPELNFIHQPDPLCCLITAALQDSNSQVPFDKVIFSCTHSPHVAEPGIQHTSSSKMSRSSITTANPPKSSAEVLIHYASRKRNAILNSRYISPTRNGTVPPTPVEISRDAIAPAHHPSYNLSRKIQDGQLPPLPTSTSTSRQSSQSAPSSSSEQAEPSSRPPGISSTTPVFSTSAPPRDLPTYPDRPTSMCGGCLVRRHRPLYSHPYYRRDESSPQFANPPLPYPLSPREQALPPRIDSLPTSLRPGPQCRHCRARRSGIVSPPGLVGPRALNRLSASFSDTAPDSPWAGPVGHMGFYAESVDDVSLSVESDGIDESVGSSGLEMCLNAGSVAQSRRYR
ncbi:unnamed protein product [Penicillium glandicola]